MQNYVKKIILITACLCFSFSVFAEKIKWDGSARIRGEFKNNQDFSYASNDESGTIGSRFRLGMKATPHQDVVVYLQPQFTKIWGQQELNLTSTSPTVSGSTSNTSGALNDTGIDVHQAYLSYITSENFEFQIGRQEMIYGDHLLIGNVGWSNVGRSFDAIRIKMNHGIGWSHLIASKILETGGLSGDSDFWGFYNSIKTFNFFKDLDLYFLHSWNRGTSTSFVTYGIRSLVMLGEVSWRFEGTGQTTNSYQVDTDFTFKLGEKFKALLGYFRASSSFNQLYPTAHKWLGYADFFSRRNIQGLKTRLEKKFNDKTNLELTYHWFLRAENSKPAYQFSGNAIGIGVETGSTIAHEIDLVAKYQINEAMHLAVGGALILPGAYIKNTLGSDLASFAYLETGATF